MKPNRKITFKRKLLYAAVASCFAITPAYANPVGAAVVNGQVGFATQGSTLTITNTPNAIINWQQFSISPSEITRFVQQSASSAVLNRVLGQDPSQILGSLLSNGRVFLINPNGIVFGQGAVIDVAGLVASTLRLSDGDFLAGKLNFTNGVGAGGIDNQGSITTPNGGNIYLIAPDIRNSGLITSPQGEILLAAGHTVNLMDTANPNVQVTLSAPGTQAVNIGTLMAQSGKIGIYGALIDQQGTVDANTAVVGANGQIMLRASKDITLEPGSLTTASGMSGGVRDGGEIRIVADGTLNMRQGSQVHVDGGVDGGNGGFLELSGKQKIALNGVYTGRAQKAGYRGGSLLLDPLDIVICEYSAHGCASIDSMPSSFTGTVNSNDSGTTGPGTTLYVHHNMSRAGGYAYPGGWTDVTLAAIHDITVADPISNTDVPTGGSLTLTAGNDINVNADIGSSGTRFNHDLTLTAGNNVNITNASIYLDNNALTIRATGDVNFLADSNTVNVQTLGLLDISGHNVNFTAIGGEGSGSLNVSGGSMIIDAINNMTLLTSSGCCSSRAQVYLNTTSGNQTITVGNDLTLNAYAGSASIHATGNQVVVVGNDLILNSGNSGSASIGANGNQNITVGRDLTINASGSSPDIWADGTQTIDVVRNLTLNASSSSPQIYGYGDQNITVGGNLALNGSGSSVSIVANGNQTISVVGDMALHGSSGGGARVEAYGALQNISTLGNLTLVGGNGYYAGADIYGGSGTVQTITVGGDLSLTGGLGSYARASIMGNPDTHLDVGGVIRLQKGAGLFADARIESGAPASIYINYPNRYSGGYFVYGDGLINGEGVISSGNTGFFADGAAAILDTNLHITYLTPVTGFGTPVIGALNFGIGETNGAATPPGLIETISLGNQGEDEENDKPVCK